MDFHAGDVLAQLRADLDLAAVRVGLEVDVEALLRLVPGHWLVGFRGVEDLDLANGDDSETSPVAVLLDGVGEAAGGAVQLELQPRVHALVGVRRALDPDDLLGRLQIGHGDGGGRGVGAGLGREQADGAAGEVVAQGEGVGVGLGGPLPGFELGQHELGAGEGTGVLRVQEPPLAGLLGVGHRLLIGNDQGFQLVVIGFELLVERIGVRRRRVRIGLQVGDRRVVVLVQHHLQLADVELLLDRIGDPDPRIVGGGFQRQGQVERRRGHRLAARPELQRGRLEFRVLERVEGGSRRAILQRVHVEIGGGARQLALARELPVVPRFRFGIGQLHVGRRRRDRGHSAVIGVHGASVRLAVEQGDLVLKLDLRRDDVRFLGLHLILGRGVHGHAVVRRRRERQDETGGALERSLIIDLHAAHERAKGVFGGQVQRAAACAVGEEGHVAAARGERALAGIQFVTLFRGLQGDLADFVLFRLHGRMEPDQRLDDRDDRRDRLRQDFRRLVEGAFRHALVRRFRACGSAVLVRARRFLTAAGHAPCPCARVSD